jgi:hypothetical protein
MLFKVEKAARVTDKMDQQAMPDGLFDLFTPVGLRNFALVFVLARHLHLRNNEYYSTVKACFEDTVLKLSDGFKCNSYKYLNQNARTRVVVPRILERRLM